jgi:protein-tyrosine phosphatase
MLVEMHNRLLNVRGRHIKDDDETIRILKSAATDGITHMIATPLHQKGKQACNIHDIKIGVKQLNNKLRKLNVPITILEGMEVSYYDELANDIEFNVLPVGRSNKYVFIGFPNHCIPPLALKVFFEMQLLGYIPIIANAELNEEIQNDPSKLYDFVNKGALIHVGAGSVLGKFGRKIQKLALKLCQDGQVHFIFSVSQINDNQQSHLKSAYKYLEKKLSIEAVEYFMFNAESLVKGIDFNVLSPIKSKMKYSNLSKGRVFDFRRGEMNGETNG